MIEKMPENYKGKITKKTNYTISSPRKWTTKEIEWLELKLAEGYSSKQIAYSMDKTQTSVAIKMKRLSKKDNTYNYKHIEEKYYINEKFINFINPQSILDLYCGEKNFYRNYNVTTNDINKKINADYHKDALKLLCELYSKDMKFDLIDLDPFGSAYDCFDLAIKMAKKGLCITLGELGHKRWKRLDYVSSHYGIDNIDNLTLSNLIKEIQKIGLRNKKQLIVYESREWLNIGRVWFEIKTGERMKSQVKQRKKKYDLFDFLEEENYER